QDGAHRIRELLVHAARLPRARFQPARGRAPLRRARRLQGRDAELQRHPPGHRRDGDRHRARRLRHGPRVRARAPPPRRPDPAPGHRAAAGRPAERVKVSLFYLPSVGSRADVERGLAGLRGDLYQQMLAELAEQAKLADTLGYDSISFTEHHFHVEGFELSNSPVLLDLFVGLQTKRLRVGQLGIVLPAHNPIRVAEEIAMLDHMTGGRANAGFARGYQRRWVDVMAQQTHGIHGALPNQHDEIDEANRQAFEENFRIVKQCWTEEMLTFDGKFWKVPAGPT